MRKTRKQRLGDLPAGLKKLVPKGCVVHSVFVTKSDTEVRFRCDGETGQNEYVQHDKNGQWAGTSNYPSLKLKGKRSIRLPNGLSVSGADASVHGFMDCKREGKRAIHCEPHKTK